uniref:Uncharacterized protein n=1 Tax=Ditylenchus dipsaci TaxID=166011 RepID=A0A915DXE6_9BILA
MVKKNASVSCVSVEITIALMTAAFNWAEEWNLAVVSMEKASREKTGELDMGTTNRADFKQWPNQLVKAVRPEEIHVVNAMCYAKGQNPDEDEFEDDDQEDEETCYTLWMI